MVVGASVGVRVRVSLAVIACLSLSSAPLAHRFIDGERVSEGGREECVAYSMYIFITHTAGALYAPKQRSSISALSEG